MRVKVLKHFGNHFPGEICDSIKRTDAGKVVDIEQDRNAYAYWIKTGWAVELDDADAPIGKQVDEPPANKAVESPQGMKGGGLSPGRAIKAG